LKELYLRKNNINEPEELKHLKGLKNLRTLWIGDNPVVNTMGEKRSRAFIIQTLPQLEVLDDVLIGEKERALATLRQASVYSSCSTNSTRVRTGSNASSEEDPYETERLSLKKPMTARTRLNIQTSFEAPMSTLSDRKQKSEPKIRCTPKHSTSSKSILSNLSLAPKFSLGYQNGATIYK
jgi:hypothetical protein